VVVGRTLGIVTVTVIGELSLAGGGLLEDVFTDLIGGQGNLTVHVDLEGAIVKPEALLLLRDATRRYQRQGATLVLRAPSIGPSTPDSTRYCDPDVPTTTGIR